MPQPIVSIETPVFKGGWLRRCITSVLSQSSPHWTFSLLWDGGDRESRKILEELDRQKHPNVTVHFAENRGIARARRFLTEHSRGDFILPVDDDDVLPFNAVERYLAVAEQRPWASVIRAQRKIIDLEGKVLDIPPWFPFEPRHYQDGMVSDLMNHTHPYLVPRWAYERTSGWEGFEDFGFAGEDCDIYIKLEEVGSVELLDETLYYYRLNPKRTSLVLTDDAALEMWRRLADKTIARIGLPLKRMSERPPFEYQRLPRPHLELGMVDFVIPAGAESGPAPDRTAESLRRSGITDDAVHLIGLKAPGAWNDGFRRTSRPLVCVLDPAVDLDGAGRIESLVRALQVEDLDLAAPKLVAEDGKLFWAGSSFSDQRKPVTRGEGERDQGQYDETIPAPWLPEKMLLVRREVVKAVGGTDEGYHDDRMAMIDFCFRARQRQFRCGYVGRVAFTFRGSTSNQGSGELERLQQKWGGYPNLFA